MLEPKKQRRSLADERLPKKFCENPMCGARLPMKKAKDGAKYCDTKCRIEHKRILGMEQRPAEIRCSNCDTLLDPMSRSPNEWERSDVHFCDSMCADEYRRKHGLYKAMSAKGNREVKEYKEKHGKVHSHEKRSKAVSENNIKAPPKAKYFDRQGKVWGYDVHFAGTGTDYIVTVPELPDLGELRSATKKQGLLMVRQRILEIRAIQRKIGKEKY
jgi:hypothetical protein